MVEEDAAIEPVGEVDLEGEAALVHKMGAEGQLHLAGTWPPVASVSPSAAAATVATVATTFALFGILGAAGRVIAHPEAHVLWGDAHDLRRDGEYVEQPLMREVLVDLLGSGILRDLQPAAGRERALVEVDRHGIVGQVRVVHAVAGDVLVLCPLGAELRHLGESQRELVGRRHEHGNPPASGELDERLLGLLERCVVPANRLVAASHEHVDGLGGGDPHGDVDGR